MPMYKESLWNIVERDFADSLSRRIVRGTWRECRWLPVASFTSASTGIEHLYGIAENGFWTSGGDTEIAPEGDYWGFFPLLESTQREVVDWLVRSIRARGLPDAVLLTFPLDGLVVAALALKNHWAALAEKWVDDGYPESDGIAEHLPYNRKVVRWKTKRLNRVFFLE